MNAMVEELAADRAAPGLLGLAERGLLPDVLIRAGIRRLCEQRLAEELEGGVEAQSLRQRQRLEELRQSPLAIETEAANSQHYELPPAFFGHCLGPRLKYSSCYYPTGTETLVFNAKDQAACGQAVVDAANALLAQQGKPGRLTMSQATRDLRAGFVLQQGDIEVNCAVETIAELCRSDLAAQVAEVLFGA